MENKQITLSNITEQNNLFDNIEKKLRGGISNNSPFIFSLEGFNSFSCQLWNNQANPFISFSTSNDGIYWTPLQVSVISGYVNSSAGFRLSNNNPMTIVANKVGNFIKITQTSTTSYTSCNIVLSESQFLNKDNNSQFLQDNIFRYVSTSGINNTNPITLVSATSPSFSNIFSILFSFSKLKITILFDKFINIVNISYLSSKSSYLFKIIEDVLIIVAVILQEHIFNMFATKLIISSKSEISVSNKLNFTIL